MTEQLLDLVDAAAGVHQVAAESVPQLVRRHRPGQPRPPAQRRDQLTDRGRDGAELTTKAYAGAIALFLRWCARTGRDWVAGVEQLGLFVVWLRHAGPRPVDVVIATDHVQVRPRHITAQRPRVQQQMHVAAAQPGRLPAAQPGPGQQQHDQPVPGVAADPQQRDDLLVASPVHPRLRHPYPVPGPQPPRHPHLLAPHRCR
ncbi:MAG TPA: hypothetical protein VFM55_09335 [Micromonosporaceae bacterium]|nr:hypothetical protein [Micromonosporaceae bacterium]